MVQKLLFLTYFLSACLCSTLNAQKIHIMEPSGSTVEKWEKFEIGISLPKEMEDRVTGFIQKIRGVKGINPFDPDQLNIEAVFTGPDNTTRTIYGFYLNDFKSNETEWEQKPTEYKFRVRFAPNQIGRWTTEIHVKADGTQLYLGKIDFNCIAGKSKGTLLCSNTKIPSSKYLTFSETKETFFAVGLNLVWTDLIKINPNDQKKYTKWIDQLSQNGGNYIQLSSLPFTHGVEWESLGDYSGRMQQAWEFDYLLDYCHKKGIYVNLLTLIHDEFMTNPNMWIHQSNHWSNNPYNKNKNGGLTNANTPDEFFTDDKCKLLFKKRLRYILSRYGYSTNLAVLELLSEVDNAMEGYKEKTAEGAKKKANFKKWFNEMKSYIENDLGYAEKLVSVSYTQNDQSEEIEKGVFTDADLILLHFYGRGRFTNYTNRYNQHIYKFSKNENTKFKPIIFDEMGANVFPGLDRSSDLTFHLNLWATSFMGCYGTGQNWWWENAILLKGYETNFRGLSNFLGGENFAAKNFVNKTWLTSGAKFKNKTKFESFYLVSEDGEKALGWLHNTSFWWANQKNTNPDVATFIKNNNGSHIEQADNTEYTKEYDKGKATGSPQEYKGYKLTIEDLSPSTEYLIKWYDTKTGEPNGTTEKVKSGSNGKIKFTIPDIKPESSTYGDLAFKVVKFSK